jgi:DNA polymerase-3 subunit gamma/tau
VSDSLALKYRPREFSDIIGQRLTAVVLEQMVKVNRIPTGLLFSGIHGSGKTSAARILASKVTGENAEASAGLRVIEIDAASNGTVGDIRALIETLRYDVGSEHRVVILDEAQSMTREAFNALLKTLEEPPAGTIFILNTTEPDKIPDTVKSRLMEFEFSRVAPAEILDRLALIATAEKINVTVDLLELLSDRANGSVRDAIVLLDQISVAGIRTKEEFAELSGDKDTASPLLFAFLTGDLGQSYQALEVQMRLTGDPSRISSSLVGGLRDILVLRSGGTIKARGLALQARNQLAHKLSSEQVLEALKLLWDLKTKIRPSEDALENLELVVGLLTRILASQIKETPIVAPIQEEKVEERLSLSDLQ